ncbi:hypothetical protein [Microcoleus vaginatus]|uniref:hypothetical protein n=1 Tax=Microcoleus vaginatus TaxID=119532 RepID=UPI001F61EAB4
MGNRTQDGLRFAGRRRWGHISLCTTIERSALAPFYSQLLANFTIGPTEGGDRRLVAIDFGVIGEPAGRAVS